MGDLNYDNFYPRSPCGERRCMTLTLRCFELTFLSTLSLRRATGYICFYVGDCNISIHALLAESDLNCSRKGFAIRYFYPRSPCGERRITGYFFNAVQIISIHALLAESDNADTKNTSFHKLFLSTLSLRRATPRGQLPTTQPPYFYPRSPCGERLYANFSGFYWWIISIHALLAESDS